MKIRNLRAFSTPLIIGAGIFSASIGLGVSLGRQQAPDDPRCPEKRCPREMRRISPCQRSASGVYFYTLKAGDFTATRQLLIRK